ncbi:MAG: DoxX family protein [Gemmatimonadaceae bacterium]|nr:DoxX family protein [Gemmatimonadaceae bacterium]
MSPIPERFAPYTHAALRIFAGAAFFSHGAQKLLGWFGGFGPDGGTAELMSRFGAAGTIETLAGACILLGFGTRWAAFLASGEMAVTYFWMHSARVGSIWWWENRGEVVMLFCFIFLMLSAAGSGPWSIDAARAGGSPQKTAD